MKEELLKDAGIIVGLVYGTCLLLLSLIAVFGTKAIDKEYPTGIHDDDHHNIYDEENH